MRKFIKLDKDGVTQIKAIREGIKESIYTVCPEWQWFVISQDDKSKQSCKICKELFPKIVVDTNCPCHVYKNKKYLIRCLTEIINYNEKNN